MAIELLFLLGCRPDPGDATPFDVVIEVSEDIPTVATVTWRTAAKVVGAVHFGEGDDRSRTTPAGPVGAEHSAVLMGLPENGLATFLIEGDDVVYDFETGSLPADMPRPALEGGPFPPTVIALLGDFARIVVLDAQGRVVWHHRDSRELSVFRARPLRDGTGIVYASAVRNGGPAADSVFVKVSWDGQETEVPIAGLAHDFVELSDGTLVALAFQSQDDLLGNRLVSVSLNGEETDLWNSWDCFDPVAQPGNDPVQGWTHANALDLDESNDRLLVGLRNLGTIAAVDRQTGACAWTFGGQGATISPGGAIFVHQHQFELVGERMLVFDNDGARGNESRVLEFDFDESATNAPLVRTFQADPPLYSFILGDAHRLPQDQTAIVWSVPALIDVVDGDGTRLSRLTLGSGDLLGFADFSGLPY